MLFDAPIQVTHPTLRTLAFFIRFLAIHCQLLSFWAHITFFVRYDVLYCPDDLWHRLLDPSAAEWRRRRQPESSGADAAEKQTARRQASRNYQPPPPPKFLRRDNMTSRTSHTRYPFVPKSMTSDDLEGLLRALFQNTCVFRSPPRKFEWR